MLDICQRSLVYWMDLAILGQRFLDFSHRMPPGGNISRHPHCFSFCLSDRNVRSPISRHFYSTDQCMLRFWHIDPEFYWLCFAMERCLTCICSYTFTFSSGCLLYCRISRVVDFEPAVRESERNFLLDSLDWWRKWRFREIIDEIFCQYQTIVGGHRETLCQQTIFAFFFSDITLNARTSVFLFWYNDCVLCGYGPKHDQSCRYSMDHHFDQRSCCNIMCCSLNLCGTNSSKIVIFHLYFRSFAFAAGDVCHFGF